MKFDQLIEYNKRYFFFENHAQIVSGRLVLGLFLFVLKKNFKFFIFL